MKNSKKIKYGVFVSLGLIWCSEAYAQMEELEESTVVAARASQKIDSVIASLFSEDSSYFTDRGITDLSQGLDSLAGITSTKSSGQRGASRGLSIRGLKTNDVQLRIDGVRVSNTSFALNSVLGAMTTNEFNRIEVLKGAQSSLYGDGATAGVVSLTSNTDTSGGSFYSEVGSFDSVLSVLNQAGTVGNFSYAIQLGAEYSENDTYDGNSEIASADNDYRNFSGSVRIEYQLTDDLQLGATYRDFHSRYENPQFGGTLTKNEVELGTLYADWQVTDRWRSKLTFSYLDNVLNSSRRGDYDQRGLAWENGYQVSDSTQIAFGAEHEKLRYQSGSTDAEDNYSAVFVNGNTAVTEQLSLNGGVRYEEYDSFSSEVTWTAGISYAISQDFRMRASAGTAFNAPSLSDLYAPEEELFGSIFGGNPDLKPETSESWELGFDYQLGDFANISATYFETIKEDAIDSFVSPMSMNLAERAVANGFEVSIQGLITEQLSYQIAYTNLDNQIVSGVADQTAYLGLMYAPNDKWNLGVSINYEGERDLSAPLDSFAKVDLFARYAVSENVTLSARIDNVFDEEYLYADFGDQYPAARLGAALGLNVTW